jgi:NNP family nitrate/nitrite transporter-like MFS transporter
LNFLSRIALSPLLPTIEKDLGVGHGAAGSFFLLISLGYFAMLLASSIVSSQLNHRKTILLSSVLVGCALLFVSMSRDLWGMRLGFVLVGMAAGLYLPSGLVTLTALVRPQDLGKSIAVHELAPNLAYVVAPLLVETLLRWGSWRDVLMVLGFASMLSGFVFGFWGKGGTFRGEIPNTKTLSSFLFTPSFWFMAIIFTLGIGAALGVYSMIPLYLVAERGMEKSSANALVALSRIPTLGIAFLSGWITDRIGPKRTLKVIFVGVGAMTSLLGLTSGSWLSLIVFLQPLVATAFFPPGLTMLSNMSSVGTRNLVTSLTVAVGFLLGGGVIPSGLGVMGEVSSFRLGFVIAGVLFASGALLIPRLRLVEE